MKPKSVKLSYGTIKELNKAKSKLYAKKIDGSIITDDFTIFYALERFNRVEKCKMKKKIKSVKSSQR